jgi:PAT family beta-lactamase induction signal transducer AmpG
MAVLMGIGITTCLLMREPAAAALKSATGMLEWLRVAVIGPLVEFSRRDAWVVVLAFILLFKLGEALAGVMTAPFYRSLGFSREEVAAVSTVFGLLVTLSGVAVGGVVVYQLGVYRALIATGFLQMLSNLMYVALSYAGHDVGMLFLQVGVEGFTDGMADAAFVAYLSSLTNIAFTATQYALLSSLATVPLRTLSAGGGFLAEAMGWPAFFLLTTAAALPALCIALWLMKRFPAGAPQPRPAVIAD